MIATTLMLNKYFWKTIYGPVLAFLFPVIILAIIGHIFRIEYVFPGIIALAFMFTGIIAMPLAVMELKQSSLFKYIGSSSINAFKFTLTVIGFYIFIALVSMVILFLSTLVFFKKQVFTNNWDSSVFSGVLSFTGFFSFILSIIIHLVFSIVIGMGIVVISKTSQQALTIGLLISIPSMFLSGMIVSVDIIAQSNAMNWISRIMPFRYSTGNIIIAMTPTNQLKSGYETLLNTVIFVKDSSGHIIKTNLWEEVVEKDTTLFQIMNNKLTYIPSSNNIFSWMHSWGARKIPEVEQVKNFQIAYLQGDDGKGGIAGPARFATIWAKIKANDFTWMDIFFKQSNALYFPIDRVLNIFLPVLISFSGSYLIYKRFSWSAR